MSVPEGSAKKGAKLAASGKGVGSFSSLALGVQAALALVLAIFGTNGSTKALRGVDSSNAFFYYALVAVMMLVGFGYLMTFLKHYGTGAVGLTMFVTCLGVQVDLVVEALCKHLVFPAPGTHDAARAGFEIVVSFPSLLDANFAVAAVLISFGAVIGRASPSQLVVMTVVELAFYAANKIFFLTNALSLQDCGGTIIIHMFGAYFGLAASKAMGAVKDEANNISGKISDVFSLVGTSFLWLFWPAFVAGALEADSEQRSVALLNTIVALLGSTVATFAWCVRGGKFDVVAVQNATLAGGVAIGATANIGMRPGFALILGIVAGLLSTWGFQHSQTFAHDTCGVHNLHGMPSVLGGLFSAVLPFIVAAGAVGPQVHAAAQLTGVAGTLVFAIVGGSITGAAMRVAKVEDAVTFSDGEYWEVAHDFAAEK